MGWYRQLSGFQKCLLGCFLCILLTLPVSLAERCVACDQKINQETRTYLNGVTNPDEEREYLVKFTGAINRDTLSDVLVEHEFSGVNIAVVRSSAKEIEVLLDSSVVEFIELDQDITLFADLVPWGVEHTLSPAAWNLTSGSGVKVAILDTGVAPHSDLSVAGGISFVSGDYADLHGHGTEVAGVVAAVKDNVGIVGAAYDADLYAVKIMNGSSGKLSDAIAGVEWAVDNNMSVASMSFGTLSYSQIFRDVLKDAYDSGVLLVASSGNSGSGVIFYPAGYSSVIAVGAVDENNDRASFSSYGLEQELVAPGVNINTTTLGDTYAIVNGTSVASSHVVGVAALLKAYNPSLSNVDLRGKLRNDAVDIRREGRDDEYGWGLVQTNLTSTNYSLGNDSYFYEVFNISDYGQPNESYSFWLNGTGTIDDITFGVGYFLLRIPPYPDRKLFVDENGTVILLLQVSKMLLDDNWTNSVDSNATDGVVWNDTRYIRARVDTTDQVGECWDFDVTDSNYDFCYFKDSSTKSMCQSQCNSHGISHDDPECAVGSMGIYHTILNGTNSILNKTVRYSGINSTCGTPNGPVTKNYYVVNEKRYQCLVDGNYSWQGKYASGSLDWTSVGGSIDCDAGDTQSCDSALYQSTCGEVDCGLFTLCRKNDGESCGQDADCFFNHYCADGVCQTSPPSCTATDGTINVLTEDRTGAPVEGLSVYYNGDYNTSTNMQGAALIEIRSSLDCSENQEVKVTCSDNTTICGLKNVRISLDNDIDSLSFDCTKCTTNNDLYMDHGSVFVDFLARTVTVTVFSTGVTSSFDVNVSRQDQSGLIQESKLDSVSVSAGGEVNATVTFDQLSQNDFIHVWLEDVPVEDSTNNYLFRPAVRPINAYIDVRVDPSFDILNEVIEEYLESFVTRVNNTQSADIRIRIGRIAADDPLLNDLKGAPTALTKPYTGIVITRPWASSGLIKTDREIIAYGRGIEGTIAAVKRIINTKSTFLVHTPGTSVSYIDDFDTLGISVYDQLHNTDSETYFAQNNAQLQNKVKDILSDGDFEVSVKPVKTLNTTSYGQETILRVKHVNSALTSNYKEAIGISDRPVVFSGGIFSNLEDWEFYEGVINPAKDGLATQMAAEGYDVWEIEMTGGPNTECDTCQNYTYQDLVDYYWPASIAGIVEYSGKTQLDYVGHSNGCRVALSSLNSYSTSGKNNAGFYFDFSTGQYTSSDLPQEAIVTFFGLGCPTRLNDLFSFTRGARRVENGMTQGDRAIAEMNTAGLYHIHRSDYARRVPPEEYLPGALVGFFTRGDYPISLNLMDFYNDLAIDESSTMDLSSINVTTMYVFGGTEGVFTDRDGDAVNDRAVPISDIYYINDSITSLNVEVIERPKTHGGLMSDKVTQEFIKVILNE